MSLQRTTHDVTVLPPLLLDYAKQFARIDFTDDDDQLKRMIAETIDLFERITEFVVAPSKYKWTPGPMNQVKDSYGVVVKDGDNMAWTVPVMPVSTFKVFDSGDVDITDSTTYKMLGNVTGASVEISFMTGPAIPDGVYFELTAGYADLSKLPPSLQNILLRFVTWLYDNRDMMLAPGWDAQTYANSLFSGYWVPRC